MVTENEVAAGLKRPSNLPSVPPPPAAVAVGDKAPTAASQPRSENRLVGRSRDKKRGDKAAAAEKRGLLAQVSPKAVALGDKAPEPQLQSENRLVGRSGDKKPRPPPLPPDIVLAYRVNDAAKVSGLSRSSIYNLIGDGKLRSVLVAGRRLIPADALRELLQRAG